MKFSQYLNEMVNTNRVGIYHLDKLSNIEFYKFIKYLHDNFNYFSPNDEIVITEKIDGQNLKFGLDKNNKFFIESSYSPLIYEEGEYTNFVKSKGYEPNFISENFEKILKLLKSYTKLINILEKYNNGNGIKLITECLFNDAGIINKDKIKFVTIEYDRMKLGKIITLVILNVIDGNGVVYENKNEIMDDLVKISNDDIKIQNLNKFNVNKDDIKYILTKYSNLFTDENNIISILKSKSNVLKKEKEILVEILNKIKDELKEYLMKQLKTPMFGKNFEGIVIDFANKYKLKIWSDYFKSNFKKV